MASLKSVVKQYQDLSKEWSKGSSTRDLAKCGKLLAELKFSLTELSFLPTKEEDASKQELIVSRDTLEVGAQYCVAVGDIVGFERYMAQLQTYYLDYAGTLPQSEFAYTLLGLNLLCLLSQNRVAEFHTELERLPANQIQNNVYIKHPVSLEQYIMEGSYNKVLLAKENVPAESFKFFIDILLGTLRDEIASCLEKAYLSISCSEAARMLTVKEGELNKYAEGRNWVSRGARFHFRDKSEDQEVLQVPSHEMANLAITYAREMEKIV